MPTRSTFDPGQGGDEASPESPTAPAEHDLAALGEHVGVVLAAAESAAEKLLIDAEREAQRVREAAAKEAQELLEQAAAEAEADRAEAHRQLARANEKARAVRLEADAYAESRKGEAAAQAKSVLHDAEQRAAEIADVVAARRQELQNEIAVSESRVRKFALSLTAVADWLEEIAELSHGKKAAEAEVELDAALQRGAEEARKRAPRQPNNERYGSIDTSHDHEEER
jgi:hypothetical protein